MAAKPIPIMFRLSPSDHTDLEARAEEAGTPVIAEYVRKQLGYEPRLYPETRGRQAAKPAKTKRAAKK